MTVAADTLPALFRRSARERPTTVFVATERVALTFRDAETWSAAVASGLLQRGVRPRDVVAFVSTNRVEMVVVWLACLRIGARFCPLNTGFTRQQLTSLFERVRPSAMVAEAPLVGTVDGAAASLDLAVPRFVLDGDAPVGWSRWGVLEATGDPGWASSQRGDVAAVLCTSGTTGASKAVALSHRWFTALCEGTERYWGFRSSDVLYCPFPLYHMDALAMTVAPAMYLGTTAAIGTRFSVRAFWDEVRRFGATVFDFMGSTLTLLWRQNPSPDDADTPARLGWGVPLPDFQPSFEERFGCTLIDCYGATDFGIPVYGIPGEPKPSGSCGKAVEGYEVAILDEEGLPVPAGSLGEICVRPVDPHTIAEGYLGDPEATLATWRGLWHHTGDLGRLDKDGYLLFEGRLTDSIRRRGENVSIQELETLAVDHPDVAEIAAIGVPSDLTEEDIKVVAVTREGTCLDPAALGAWLADRLPRFMRVRYVEVVEDVPRTETQKVRKVELRSNWRTSTTWDIESQRFLDAE
jgi:crotonobetaine/carnitine-CoA ligase